MLSYELCVKQFKKRYYIKICYYYSGIKLKMFSWRKIGRNYKVIDTDNYLFFIMLDIKLEFYVYL